jgi:hypothetical protein
MLVVMMLDLAIDFDSNIVCLHPDAEVNRRAAWRNSVGMFEGVPDSPRQQLG